MGGVGDGGHGAHQGDQAGVGWLGVQHHIEAGQALAMTEDLEPEISTLSGIHVTNIVPAPPLMSGHGKDVVHNGGDVPLAHLPPGEPPELTSILTRIQAL